jgi:uncharacterized protein YbbK (DUF523 family)
LKSNKKRIAVSACLLGVPCRYDGKAFGQNLASVFDDYEVVPICPEQLGGLPTPRTPCEIQGGDGNDVLGGKAYVVDKKGKDITEAFVKGALDALEIMKKKEILIAVLKSRSPSCGSGMIYAGSFDGKLKPGDGLVAALFKKMGIKIYNEDTCLNIKEMDINEEA